MKIKKFWVVTYPTKDSEMDDIVFESDWNRIGLQFTSGLNGNNIHSVYNEIHEAVTMGRILLAGFDIELVDALELRKTANDFVREYDGFDDEFWKVFSSRTVKFVWNSQYTWWNAYLCDGRDEDKSVQLF